MKLFREDAQVRNNLGRKIGGQLSWLAQICQYFSRYNVVFMSVLYVSVTVCKHKV